MGGRLLEKPIGYVVEPRVVGRPACTLGRVRHTMRGLVIFRAGGRPERTSPSNHRPRDDDDGASYP